MFAAKYIDWLTPSALRVGADSQLIVVSRFVQDPPHRRRGVVPPDDDHVQVSGGLGFAVDDRYVIRWILRHRVGHLDEYRGRKGTFLDLECLGCWDGRVACRQNQKQYGYNRETRRGYSQQAATVHQTRPNRGRAIMASGWRTRSHRIIHAFSGHSLPLFDSDQCPLPPVYEARARGKLGPLPGRGARAVRNSKKIGKKRSASRSRARARRRIRSSTHVPPSSRTRPPGQLHTSG